MHWVALLSLLEQFIKLNLKTKLTSQTFVTSHLQGVKTEYTTYCKAHNISVRGFNFL